MALRDSVREPSCESDSELARLLLGLRLWVLYFLHELGDSPRQAIAIGTELTADLERVLGPDHPDTLTSRNNLAEAYREETQASEAISLYEKNLAACERQMGLQHPVTLISRDNLALAYQEAGRGTEAIPLREQTLADRQQVLGPDHPDTLISQNNLAAAYQEAGHHAEAIPLYRQTLAAYEPLFGPDHPVPWLVGTISSPPSATQIRSSKAIYRHSKVPEGSSLRQHFARRARSGNLNPCNPGAGQEKLKDIAV